MSVIGSFLSRGAAADAQIAIESKLPAEPRKLFPYRGGQRIVSSAQIPDPGGDSPRGDGGVPVERRVIIALTAIGALVVVGCSGSSSTTS